MAVELFRPEAAWALSAGLATALGCCAAWGRKHRERARRLGAELEDAWGQVQSLALCDSLTGLPNRMHFERQLHDACERIRAAGRGQVAVLFVDLDGFRPINDSLGHELGDDLLRQTADRLKVLVRQGDTVARIGADEFVLLLDAHGGVADAVVLAEHVVARLGQPFTLGERHFTVSASVGIALYPDDGGAESMLGHADAAMAAAKRAGGASFALYRPHMDAGALDQLAMQDDLRQAIGRNELELHYQPKVDAGSGEISGVEALLRWRHPQRGWVSPAVFIPVAERFGLIGAIGDWVLEEACRQLALWCRVKRPGWNLQMAINVSVHQLRGEGLATRIEGAIRRHGIDPGLLLCEITESAAMEDVRSSQAVFDALVRVGVYLSIDDFGTGYSSLAYLRRLPARQLKIDRSFVNDLETSADARAVVHAVLELSHALGLRVVAEGVETAGQRDTLTRMGCDELQGYFFAKPMPAAALEQWCLERQGALVPA